jgi:hypothetical protein
MDAIKRQRLEAAGWRVGDAADFLELSPEDVAFIEMKLSLSKRLRELRPSIEARRHCRRSCLFHGSPFNVNSLPCLDYTFIAS